MTRLHNFAGWRQRYNRVEPLLAEMGLKSGFVLAAKGYVLEAPALWAVALAALRQNPLYFVEED